MLVSAPRTEKTRRKKIPLLTRKHGELCILFSCILTERTFLSTCTNRYI